MDPAHTQDVESKNDLARKLAEKHVYQEEVNALRAAASVKESASNLAATLEQTKADPLGSPSNYWRTSRVGTITCLGCSSSS